MDRPTRGLSQREYAAHRKALGLPGQTHSAVGKALKTGRITARPDGKIDAAEADRQWATETNSALQRGEASQQQAVEAARQTIAEDQRLAVPQRAIDELKQVLREAGESDDPDEGEGITYMRARLAAEILKGLRANEALKRERREVVDRKKAELLVFDLARRMRDAWIGWPSRISAEMAAELGVDPHALERALDRQLRAQLSALGEPALDLTQAAKDGR